MRRRKSRRDVAGGSNFVQGIGSANCPNGKDVDDYFEAEAAQFIG